MSVALSGGPTNCIGFLANREIALCASKQRNQTMSFELWAERLLRNRFGALPLRVELWNDRSIALSPNPQVTLSIPNAAALRYFVRPSFLSLGKAYVDGKIKIQGSAHDAFQIIESLSNAGQSKIRKPRLWKPRRRSRKQDSSAVQFHYDVSNEFYQLWLDRNLVYSCGYFKSVPRALTRHRSRNST